MTRHKARQGAPTPRRPKVNKVDSSILPGLAEGPQASALFEISWFSEEAENVNALPELPSYPEEARRG